MQVQLFSLLAWCAFFALVCTSGATQDSKDYHIANPSAADLIEWEEFKQKFVKSYDSEEEETQRFAIFRQNLRAVEKIKASSTSMQAGVTKFFDLTPEEFKSTFNPIQGLARPRSPINLDLSYVKELPETWDWEEKGYVTPVKDEGQCGSTWAMAAVDVLESVCKIAGYPLVPLSTQQIVDCNTNSYGCNGGLSNEAYQYVINAGGIETESSYPYKAENDNCVADKSKFVSCHMTSYNTLAIQPSEQNLMQFVYSHSPVVICLDAAQQSFQYYTGGVVTGVECSETYVDHCVALVGWDWINGKRAWKMKNQWGASWGLNGYVYLEIGNNTCGMDIQGAIYPCVKDVC